jgi:hypothetical protein
MESAGDDHQVRIGSPVDQPMRIVNAPRPVARQMAAQRLGFADSLERIATCLIDEGIDAF